jgi:DNA repair exonuclease SbcCD ATPase subunit
MQIELQRLILRNFQGGNFDLEAGGEDTSIFGANGTGKTRLASAFSWLLFGKDSMGRADFEIKNLDRDGNREHGLDHEVEGILNVGGAPIALKRIYHEIWAKKRGSAQRELTGNTTDYFIDGVPAKENEYKARIAEIMGSEETIKLLTSPTVFPSLPWQKQRSLLLEVCGDISDEQVIEGDEALLPLIDLLKRYTVSKTPMDDLRKVITGKRLEINKRLDQLPVRIDEVRRGLPDTSGLDRNAIEGDVTAREQLLNDAKLRLQGVDNGSGIAELSKKLAVIDSSITRIDNNHYAANMLKVRNLDQLITKLKDATESEERKTSSIINDIKSKQREIETIEAKLVSLREKWVSIDAESFQDSTEQVCAACGQSLPLDRVEAARDKAKANFNRSKAERLTETETEGKRHALNKDALIGEIENIRQHIPEVADRKSDIERLTADRDEAKRQAEYYSGIEERATLITQRIEIESSLRDAKETTGSDSNIIRVEIAELQSRLNEAKAQADKFTRRESGEKRIVELKTEEKQLAADFEELEKQLFLIESFTKRKVSLLNERINARFNLVRFKLFNQLVNGGIEDCCEITVNGVPYSGGLNSAARTQAGCEIISVLQEHYQAAPVVWIDNRESCTEIPAMNCQVISLYVSPEDKVLRVETARKERIAA